MIKTTEELTEEVFDDCMIKLTQMGVKVRKVPEYLLNNAEYRNPPYEIWAPGEDVVRFSTGDAAYVYAINKWLPDVG